MTPENENQIEGRNAVLELMKSGRDVDKLLIQKGQKEGSIHQIIRMANDNGIPIIESPKQKLDEISQTQNHQGVIAYAAIQNYVSIDDILLAARAKNEDPFIVLLDGITDPHNLGAILRSCDGAGVHGVIIPKRRSASLTGVVGKTSAGAAFYVPVAKVSNTAQTIDLLKEKGLWVYCAHMEGTVCYETDMKGPCVLVIGSEGEGIRDMIRKKCDYQVSVPMFGQVASLNASVASALLMYEVVRQRNFSIV